MRWAWLIAVLPLLGWWLTGLLDLDEGFYGAVTGEMLWRGEWITPFYNGAPWFEKPILLYWLAKPLIWIFGDALGPRLPSVLAALGVYWVLYRAGNKYLGDRAGLFAMLVCATSVLWVGLGRMMMTDALLVLCITGAVLAFWESLHGGPRARWLAGFLLGVSVLAKGPVGCVLFVLLYGWVFWRMPALRPKFRGGWLIGTALFALAVASWYVPCYLANRDLFVEKFLIEQNVKRFQGGDKAHTVPGLLALIYYPAILLVGMIPWSVQIRRAWPKLLDAASPERDFKRLCAAWASVVFIFFFVGGSKLPHYIAPCIPPLSLLIGAHLAQTRFQWSDTKVLQRFAIGAFTLCVIANLAFYGVYQGLFSNDSHAEIHALAKRARAGGGSVAVYQISRRGGDLGTGQAKLQETSHPSVVFYLKQPVLQLETPQEISALEGPTWIITRPDRLSEADLLAIQKNGTRMELDPGSSSMRGYRLYRAEPSRR